MLFEIPGYHLNEKIAENAAFRIYRGQRLQDRVAVLIKVLNRPYPTPKLVAPLWQEYEILRQFDFPGVEKALSLENHQQWWMIVLEDFGGRPLNELGIAGKMTPDEYLNLALQLADIVKEIHAGQVIHKNISPANISYNRDTRQARLANFGNASLVSQEKVPLRSLYQLTDFLAYISPELTGRMNRSVDYRTDYYSLGATLYELLTGTPPIIGESPLELVHAHLAITPDPPDSRIEPWRSSPTAFQILSAILLKLLSKNPEDRYQTHGALRADLLLCLSALQEPFEKGSVGPVFVPGQVDRPVDLNISQMIIGREQETEALLQAFLRTVSGPGELVLISGEAGVGKTTLVNQLVRPATERMGLFLGAKFDQVRYLEVYHALTEVLEEFCQLVLSEPTPVLKEWQERVQAAVAPHGQLLTDLCPQLEKVIGRQPPIEPVDESLARPRLHQVVIHFLQAVCRPDHPVVIFLDDLQWISPDSLQLWQSILSTPSLQNLLLVGAYRDNEVGPEHPIRRLVDELGTTQVRVTQLQLQNLDWSLIHRLVTAALASDPAEISELTTLVYLRTEGNPYFSNEILKSLHKDQLLAFNWDEQKWRWDANRIEEYGVASNVVDLFVHEIANLDEDTQKTLQYAACIGRRFDAATLLTTLGQDKASSLAYSLWQAMTEGLIQPLDENYRFLAGDTQESSGAESGELLPSLADLLEEEILFEFQHDRVQQAAIAMMDERQLWNTSLQIGWLLLEKAERTGQETVQENLLTIVDHINSGSALIEDPTEAIKAAQLNLMASNQARLAAAFEAADRYLSEGMQLLPPDSWQDHYALALELFTAGAEVALLNGDLARAEALALSAETNARTQLEKARIMKIRMDIYLIQTQVDQVVELGIAVIKMFGFDLEVREPPDLIGEQTMQLPDMTDPRALAVSRLIETLLSAAFARGDHLLPQLTLFFVDLFSRFGNPPGASFVYIVYAAILLDQFEHMEQGCRMGRMALVLAEKGGPSKTLYTVRFMYYTFIHHWSEPAREALSPLYENIQPAFEAGNQRFSINSQDLWAQNSLFVGVQLGQVRSKQAEALRQLDLFKQVGYTQRLRIWAQVVLNLMGEALHPQEINGDLFNEDEAQKLKELGQNQAYLFNLYVAQSFLSLLFREQQRAVEVSTSANALKLSARIQLSYAHHLFIYSLALCSAGLDAGDLAGRLEKVEQNLRLMRLWAGRVPENFLHQLELVEAEQARCLGRDEQAAESYERAIQDARRNGYVHESALAAELAAEFYLARGDTTTAIDHLFNAYYSYLAWGAAAKVEDLAKRYPEWLPPGKHEEKRLDPYTVTENQQAGEFGPSIDLNTILKASQELARETNLDELLRKLMSILIQNAGAQNGSLVLWLDDRWFLEVQASTDPDQKYALISSPLEDQATQIGGPQVPLSIIHYVINSQVDLVLKDASASLQFSQDPYIRSRRPKSILCAPLLNQGVLSGVVYLENNLAAGAFTADRLEIVQLISGQAAVSIEKARLYENLEALVEERTRELSDANRKLQDEIDERIRVEEALRLSEERYRTVFENTGTAMAVVDQDGNITLTNEEFVRLTGYPREVLEDGFKSLDLVAPEEAPKIHQYRLDRLEDPSRVPSGFEFQLVDRSGSEKAVLNTGTVLPGTRTTIISLIDISQRKQAELELQIANQELIQAEEELRAQNEELFAAIQELADARDTIEAERQRYRDLFDFAPDAYLVTNLDGKIFEANRAAAEMLGQENLTGRLLGTFLKGVDRKVFRARLAEMAAEMAAESVSRKESTGGKSGYRDWEVCMVKQDGSSVDASIAVAAVSGNQGEPISLRWMVRDISARKRAEQALQESEERLRSITETAPDFIAELDLGSRFHYVNRPPTGYLREEMIGQSLFDFIPEGYHAEVRDLLEIADRSGQLQATVFKQTLSDGTYRWQSARFAPVIGHGSVGHIVLISTDITAQKWIEQQLRDAEEFRRATLNSLSEHIAILDEEGRILWVNQAWEDFSQANGGDPAKTGVGANYLQVCDLAFGQEAEMAKEFAQGIRAALSGEVEPFELEYTCSSPEEMRWFLGRLTTFSTGDSRRVVVAHDNITQIKQYEQALQKSEALYRAVVNTQTELVCRYLPDTTLTFVNEAYCRFTGKSAGELVGQSYLISIPEEIHAFIRQTVIGMVEHPETQEFEQYAVSPTGELRWQRWVHSPIFTSGSVVEFQAVGFDITERKNMELLLQENEARLRFALDSAQLAPFEYNIQAKELVWDERTKSLWGVPAGESPGYAETLQTVHPEDRQRAELAFAQAADPAGSGDFEQEFRVVWPDGSVHWISAKGKVSFAGEDGQRRAERLLGILRDTTEQKAMQDLLRENEARLRIAMDAAQLAPFDFNLLTGEMAWDERIKKLLKGFPAGDSPAYPGYDKILQLIHPEDRQRADHAVAYAIKSGGSGDFEQELRLLWPDGPVQWISAKGKLYFDSVDGQRQAARLAGILRDITERKRAEEALRYNEALLRKVLEVLPAGVWIIDKNSRIISANPEGQRIWAGAKYVELPEFGEYKAWRADTGERVKVEEWAGGLAVTQGQVTLNEELEIEAFDGVRRTILNSAIPLVTEEDGPVGAIVVNQDITERKRDEEELQKAHDQLATLLSISQSIVSILDLDSLLNLIIEQLGKVMPFEGAAILILQGSSLEFRVIRGPSIFQGLSKYQIPVSEPTLIAPLIKEREAFYIPDLQNEASLLLKIQNTIKITYDQFTFLRSWLGLPLIAKDVLVGILVLAHSQPDYYSPPSRQLSQAYANQVAIAIHNAQLYEQASAIAALEERNRLARELHDSVAQALYSISLFTDATRMALQTHKLETVKEHLGELTQLTKEAMSDMRLMIFELRPPILEKDGLVVALQSRLDSVEARTGFQADLQTEGEFNLSQEEESELYRIAQEALNNLSKHAHADQVKVLLKGEGGSFKMIIEDNGVGFDPITIEQGGGQGIRNIRERAEGIGAACWIQSAPGQGTKITIEVKK